MTTDEAQRRQAITRIGLHWPSGWTDRTLESWARTLRPYPPDHVDTAIQLVIDEHTSWSKPPTPGAVVHHAKAIRSRVAEWERHHAQDLELGTNSAGPHPFPTGASVAADENQVPHPPHHTPEPSTRHHTHQSGDTNATHGDTEASV